MSKHDPSNEINAGNEEFSAENLNSETEASNESEVNALVADGESVASSNEDDPFKLNDAMVLGEIPENVLALPLMLGFGRNEKDKRWPARQMTWANLVGMLTKHAVGEKEGTAFIQGVAIAHERKANAISELYIMGLDVDFGVSFQWAVDRVKEMGLSSACYTTHSNMKTKTFILESSFGQFARRNKLDQFPTLETMKRFLREELHWEQWVVDTVSIGEETEHVKRGVSYALTHAPMPKFRIIFPLSTPYVVARQRMSQADAIALWKSKLVGLAKTIGLPLDEACLDPSRLFYLPRHDKGKPFEVAITGGFALDFDLILEGRPHGQKPEPDNVFTASAKELGATGENKELKRWAARTANKFDIAKLFREVAPSRVRAEQSGSKLSVDCPFDAFHSNAGDDEDRGCFVQKSWSRDRIRELCVLVLPQWVQGSRPPGNDRRGHRPGLVHRRRPE